MSHEDNTESYFSNYSRQEIVATREWFHKIPKEKQAAEFAVLKVQRLNEIRLHLDKVFEIFVKPLHFSKGVEENLAKNFDQVYSAAEDCYRTVDGILLFETVYYKRLIDTVGSKIRQLRVMAYEEFKERIVKMPSPWREIVSKQLKYSLKRTVKNKKFLGETPTEWQVYAVDWINDVDELISSLPAIPIVSNDIKKRDTLNLPDLFSTEEGFQFCLRILEHIEVTQGGKSILTNRKAGRLFGVIIAIKRTPGLLKSDYTEMKLLKVFNTHLQTTFAQIKKDTKTFEESLDEAKRFIKLNKLHSK
jgi:hypothetical protein